MKKVTVNEVTTLNNGDLLISRVTVGDDDYTLATNKTTGAYTLHKGYKPAVTHIGDYSTTDLLVAKFDELSRA